MTSHLETARTNMLKQQIRACDVLDDHILAIIENSQREQYVPTAYQSVAYADTCIPLANNQQMMLPKEEGNMLQALNIQKTENVLEIGTGTGYMTSLLAQLAKFVVSIDIFDEFTHGARQRLDQQKIDNIKLETADASKGWDQDAPYDVIAITGSMPLLPKVFLNNLRVGGRLFVVLGDAPNMCATVFTRTNTDTWDEKKLFETHLIPLINAPHKPKFEF